MCIFIIVGNRRVPKYLAVIFFFHASQVICYLWIITRYRVVLCNLLITKRNFLKSAAILVAIIFLVNFYWNIIFLTFMSCTKVLKYGGHYTLDWILFFIYLKTIFVSSTPDFRHVNESFQSLDFRSSLWFQFFVQSATTFIGVFLLLQSNNTRLWVIFRESNAVRCQRSSVQRRRQGACCLRIGLHRR